VQPERAASRGTGCTERGAWRKLGGSRSEGRWGQRPKHLSKKSLPSTTASREENLNREMVKVRKRWKGAQKIFRIYSRYKLRISRQTCSNTCKMPSTNRLDALFLCQNAREFYRLPVSATLGHDQSLYFLAISIELSLKAYLRHTGMTDDETRQLVRHDLSKGFRFAVERGFDPPELIETEMIEVISRRYACGGFRRPPTCVWRCAFVKAATAFAVDLNMRVALCLAG